MRNENVRPQLTIEQLKLIAAAMAENLAPPKPMYKDGPFLLEWKGDVTPKERPRSTRTGRVYTPPATQKFEASVKEAAQIQMHKQGIAAMFCPVAVHLRVYEPIPQSWGNVYQDLAKAGLVYPSRRDLDNQMKAIMDAINGVVFNDDRQVVQVFAVKAYGDAGFSLAVTPVGLSMVDAENVKKMFAAKRK
jgi:Holliday junction resolvase RusA-like endonuclease